MVTNDPNVGVAFGLVIGAGAATAIGASVVFFPSLVKLASRRVLAGSLGLSAGVMTYVSFVEIFQKALGSFSEAGHDDQAAYLYTTLCFFGGVIIMMLIDLIVKCLSGGHHHGHDEHDQHHQHHEHEEGESCHSDVMEPHCACCADDPVADLEEMKMMAEELEHEGEKKDEVTEDVTEPPEEVTSSETPSQRESTTFAENVPQDVENSPRDSKMTPEDDVEDTSQGEQDETLKKSAKEVEEEHHENRRLVHMGINTALAIGLHNFPEGLATFVAALDDPRVGAVLAVAIGIHNIPEGLCVALPIYYATGNRCKAFMWALVSGLSEPIAALLGWAVLANSFSENLYAVLFGLVAGMMVMISAKELLPTAHRYDPEDSVVTYSFIGGMTIMALSLVLFLL